MKPKSVWRKLAIKSQLQSKTWKSSSQKCLREVDQESKLKNQLSLLSLEDLLDKQVWIKKIKRPLQKNLRRSELPKPSSSRSKRMRTPQKLRRLITKCEELREIKLKNRRSCFKSLMRSLRISQKYKSKLNRLNRQNRHHKMILE